MLDWVYEWILKVFRHYKEMTAFMLVVTILKISIPIFFSWLNKIMEKKDHRYRVKLWTDRGYSEQEAEEIIRRFDDSVREKTQKKIVPLIHQKIHQQKDPLRVFFYSFHTAPSD